MSIETGPSDAQDQALESNLKKPEGIFESGEAILEKTDTQAEFQENEARLAMLRESVAATETGLDKTRDELEIPHLAEVPPSIAQTEEKISLLDSRQHEIRDFVPEVEFAGGEEYLEELKAHFADLKDPEGRPFMIEKGVLDATAAFNALGYQTGMSCEGHAESRALPYAWVSFENDFSRTDEGLEYQKLNKEMHLFLKSNGETGAKSKDFPNYQKLTELRESVGASDRELEQKLEAQLAEFYAQQGGADDFKYAVERIFSSPRIVPEIAKQVDSDGFDEAQRREWVEKSRAELARLTSYLKEKYIAESAKPNV